MKLELGDDPIDFDCGHGCQLRLYPKYFEQHSFNELRDSLSWETHQIRLFGKTHALPRLVAWYGDADTQYRYSGITHKALGWHPTLAALRDRLAQDFAEQYNSVLCNYYRNGQDGMGWHADDEAQLGPEPSIASISLGETRQFQLKHRFDATKRRIQLPLQHGDLLIMQGALQSQWYHSLPKTRRELGGRINLTFRQIKTA